MAVRSGVFVLGLGLLFSGAAHAQLSLGGYWIDDKVQERLQSEFEQRLEDQVEENIEQDIHDDIEMIVEDSIEESIEDTIAGNVEEHAEQAAEEAVEESVAQNVEGSVEDAVEESVTDAVEASVVASVEESVTESVEESVVAGVEESVTDSVEETVVAGIEESVIDSVEETVVASVEESVTDTVEQGVEAGLEQDVEQLVEEQVAEAVVDRLEGEIDEILERIENELEVDERRISHQQWLVMAEAEVFDELAEEGYLFDRVTDLPGMGMRLAEVYAPTSFDISSVREGVLDIVGSDRAEVDLNHFYTAGSPINSEVAEGVAPRHAVSFPADMDQLELRIGMIDSLVDTSHPSFRDSRIRSRSFTPENSELPEFHGTAIASIIAANNPEYRGLAPNAEVFAAAVFQRDVERGEIASTVSLVRALDWLISSGVDVINLSLAGPANRLLEAALKRAAERDVMVLAAAGNGGPVAKPMYPAAYASVVAVTAVDEGGRAYRLANRGDYLDLAAPGVGLLHARAGGGYTASSGTSFAVPFAVAAAARLRQLNPGVDALQVLRSAAKDLGPPGRDEIYGFGLLRPGP